MPIMSLSSTDIQLLAEPAGGVPEVINTRQQFDTFVHAYTTASGPLAADAERASSFRYFKGNYLIQFKRSGAPIALLDPIALDEQRVDWNAFNRAVQGAAWIIHDCEQDIPAFVANGLQIDAVFDTEHAARLLGRKRFGLSAITEHYLGLTLAKEHSAADWSYRPLNRDLRNYAALDVEVLIELDNALTAELKKTGKWQWALEDFEHLRQHGLEEKAVHPQPWRRVSHITDLRGDVSSLAVVRELWMTREHYAQQLDIAPNLLLSDEAIIVAAQRKPRNSKQFKAIRLLNERVRIRTGDEREKMFERYASVQRQIKPQVWKEAIGRALETKYAEIRELTQPVEKPGNSAPRSMKYWREHHPERYARLHRVKELIGQVSQDTHTPVEVLLKPQYVRNLCWRDDIAYTPNDIAEFLTLQGARNWQVELLAPSLSKVII